MELKTISFQYNIFFIIIGSSQRTDRSANRSSSSDNIDSIFNSHNPPVAFNIFF